MVFYNIGIFLYGTGIRVAGLFSEKAREWVRGRRGIFDRLLASFGPHDRVIWVHCASLGEFEQGRPVIERLREGFPGHRILLTFFSPSGYTIRRDYEGADAVFYLPLDTAGNVRRFLDAVRPEAAVFVKYEFWLNYLRELRRRGIRTYIVSAIFRPDSVFFRPYGGSFRKALGTFDTVFVQNKTSKELLDGIGVRNVVVSGDTRFDRVAAIPRTAPEVPVARNFSRGHTVLVAGSTWPEDEQLLLEFLARRPEVKIILAPHEIDHARINGLVANAGAVRFTECGEETDFAGKRILVVDCIGMLSALYRYGKYAFIGGGFGAGIHNTLEAATFGLPVAFGPNFRKFREARQLIELGAARSVGSPLDLENWYASLESDPAAYTAAKSRALDYIASNKGATDKILVNFKVNK